MHCPACGQQQISTETKFCSRCGLPLSLVTEVVNHGGYLPQLAALDAKAPKYLTRRNGFAFSLIWALFFLFLMTPLIGILGGEEIAGISAVLGIFGGLIILISSALFLQKTPKSPGPGYAQFNAAPAIPRGNPQALPGQQSIPVSGYGVPQAGNWRDTNDLLPTSVTESTTRLLDEDEIKNQ